MAVTKISDLDVKNLLAEWGELSKFQMTAVVLLKNELNLQFPPSTAPFGISSYSCKYSLSLSLDEDSQAQLEALDGWLRQSLIGNPSWLGKSRVTADQLDLIYTPMVREPPKTTYASTIKIPVKLENGRPLGFVYETRDIPEIDLTPGAHAHCSARVIFSLRGLWVASGRCGPLLSLRRVLFEEGLSQVTDQIRVLEFA
jgi:hypothetical protein